MYSIRNLLVVTAAVTGAIVAFAATVPPAAAQDSKKLTVTKTCGLGGTGDELPYCLITASNFSKLVNAKIRYFAPQPGPGHPFLDSPVLIEGTGGTAFGHCLVRVAPDILGACEITGGSGSLAGFKADVTVTLTNGIWNWNGIRYVDE